MAKRAGGRAEDSATCEACQTADAIEAGTFAGRASIEDWHRCCRGAGCPCAKGHPWPSCTGCGRADQEMKKGRCTDATLCSQAATRRARKEGQVRNLRESWRTAQAEKAAERAATAPARKAAAERRTGGACEHCGEPTKGGRFVAGHDAKLKGILGRIVKDDEARDDAWIAAMAELIHRGWVPTKLDEGGFMTAKKSERWLLAEKMSTADFVTSQVAKRIGNTKRKAA